MDDWSLPPSRNAVSEPAPQPQAGQQEAAIQTFQQVCKKFPKDQHASVAHAHLQQKYKISVTLGGAEE